MVKIGRGERCRIATGQYTGDGTESHAITGLGFQPRILLIAPRGTIDGVWVGLHFYSDVHAAGFADIALGGAADFVTRDNRIDSIDPDGFTVDDDGINEHPNKSGQDYWFWAWG